MSALLLAVLLCAGPARAEEPTGPPPRSALADVSRWFDNLKKVLADSAVRHHQRRMRGSMAVAAVRGAGQSLEDPSKPYWKGTAESKLDREARQERAELSHAADLVLAGKDEEAIKALEAFEAAHPASSLLTDCRQAREKLKSPAPAAESAEVKEAATAAEPAAAKEAAPAAVAAETPAPKPAEAAAPLADEEPASKDKK